MRRPPAPLRCRCRPSLLPLGLLAALLGPGCDKPVPASKPPSAHAYPVEVVTVTAAKLSPKIAAVGTLAAFERVPVVARVAGAVTRVHFTEGDVVRRGQVLVDIEPERYALAVEAASATKARAEAAHVQAAAALARREALASDAAGLLPLEELQEHRSRTAALSAELRQAAVGLRRAELDLREARVIAPQAGVIEAREVQTGQYVSPGHRLAELVNREPLLLRFDVPAPEAAALRVADSVDFAVGTGKHAARIIHIAASAKESTGMVAVTATVESPSAALRPGTLVHVGAEAAGEATERPLIPLGAVRGGEHGFVVYTVEGERAQAHNVQLGLQTTDGQVQVRTGLQAGECLVVRGAAALRDGAKVAPKVVGPR